MVEGVREVKKKSDPIGVTPNGKKQSYCDILDKKLHRCTDAQKTLNPLSLLMSYVPRSADFNMRGSFVNIPPEGSELNSELLPAGAKRKGGLQSALSEKEWGQRLDPPSRKAIEVQRKPSNAYFKVFPGVPFFAIGSKTFFVVPDLFKSQETVAGTICTVRDKGPQPEKSID